MDVSGCGLPSSVPGGTSLTREAAIKCHWCEKVNSTDNGLTTKHMNWVGGVRRRVLLREEEQRQQDRYFAAHASSARQRSRILQGHGSTSCGYIGCHGESTDVQHPIEPILSRPRVGSHHWRNEEMVCERIKRNPASTAHTFQRRHNVTETKCPAEVNYRRKNGRSQVDVRLDEKNTVKTSGAHLIKLASIHGPFSEFLLKLEMQGIEKKFSREQLHRSSGGRLPKTLHVGELVEEQMSKRDKMPTKSDRNRHKGRKCIINDNGKEDKITKWDRRKEDNISNYISSSERKTYRKEKVKEEKRNETQKRSKNDKSKLQRTDRDENVAQVYSTRVNKPENRESIGRNGSQQNITNENMKQSDTWKGETSTYKNRDKRATWQDDRGNELKEGTCKTDLFPELKCNKRKNITCKTEDSIKTQDLFHSGMKYQKQIIKGENEKVSAKEQHSDKHKNVENTKKHESFRRRLTDTNYIASDFYEPEMVNLTTMEDKMSSKENMCSGGRKAEQRKNEQANQFKRTHASTGRTESSTSKQNIGSSFGTSNLLTGAPRFRELLTLSPERYKGRIWAPLDLSQGPFVRNETDAIILSDGNQKILESSENAIKQGNKNDENHSVKGKHSQNLTHHKKKFTKDSRTMKGKENSEWETKRLAMLFGSRLKTSPFVFSSSYNNHNRIDEMESQDTSVHKQSCNKSAESLLEDSHKEGKEDNKTRYIKVNKDDNLVSGIQDVDGSIRVGVGLRRLGERKLEVIHENNDRIEEKASQKWQTSDKSKPKLSTFTRKLVKVESGLNFAHKRKDKTPYLDKSFFNPWNLNTFINTPSSSKSSQTPSDPTLERLQEDPSGSQEGLELHNTSDHIPNISLSFENHEVLQNSVSSVKKSISQTFKNESYNKEVGMSSCSITDQLQIFKANSDNEKECIFSVTLDDNTCTSESHQILEESCLTTDHKKFKISTHVQDNSQVSTIDYTTCFENNTYSCTNSPQSSVKTFDKSLLMKHNGEIESDLNSTENKKSLSKSSFQGRDVQHISQKDKSAPLTPGCENHNNSSYELQVFSTERDTPHIPIIIGEMPCTYTSDVNQVLVKSRDVVSSGSLDKWSQLQMQINKNTVPQNLNLKIHHPLAQRVENMSSSTSVNEVKELITTQNLSNGTQKLLIQDSKRGSSCIPCKEVIHGLQVSHSEAADRPDITFFSETSYEKYSNGLTSQLLSPQDLLQPTYQFGDFPQLVHTVRHTPSTDNSNTISQEHVEEMPKISMPREGMQNFMCGWLDSLKERESECVTSTACKADVNISKGNFYKIFFRNSLNHSDKKSNSVALTDHQITRREPFGNLEMTLIQNQSIVNCGNSLRNVNDPSDHEIIKEYKVQNYICDGKGKNVEKDIYLKSGNTNSLSEIEENTQGNKESSHANWKAVLDLDDDDITCITGNKNDCCEHIKPSTSVPVNIMTKLYEYNSVCFIEESTQKLNFGFEVQGDSQENGKNKEALSGLKDVSGGQEEKQERAAKDGGENFNLEACDKTPAECCQSERNQCDNLPVDMTLGDTNHAIDSETSRHSPSTSDHIFQSTVEEELFCSSGVEEERREHWTVNPELAAQQFREVMGLTDDEPSEEY